MSFTIDGRPITQCILEVPETGPWWADVRVPGDALPRTVAMRLGATSWHGAVIEQARDGGVRKARVVAGAGQLDTVVPATWYRGGSITLRSVAESILGPTDEELGDVDDVPLGTWQTYGRTAREEIAALATGARVSWWVDREGAVRLAAREPETIDRPGGLLAERSAVRAIYAAPKGALPALPPVSIDGHTYRHLRYSIDASNSTLHAQVHAYRPPSKAEAPLAPRLATVTSQSGQTVDVQTDDGWTITDVPLYSGLPGVEVQIDAGQRVVVVYASGDPRRPVALMTPDGPPPSSITINGTAPSPPRPVVKAGDTIIVAGTAPGGLVIQSVIPAGFPLAATVLKVGES